MAFWTNFVLPPDCVLRTPWFSFKPSDEVPVDLTPGLLSDLFDLALKFGLVASDGHARCLEFDGRGPLVTVIAALPKDANGPKLSVSLPASCSGVSEVADIAVAGCEGLPGAVEWDVRLSIRDAWAMVRETDACMAIYGCIDEGNGERYGMFDLRSAATGQYPVQDFFRNRGSLIRLPSGVSPAVVKRRFVPKGAVAVIRLEGVDFLCNAQDVAYLKARAETVERASKAVYRKYGYKYGTTCDRESPDETTLCLMDAEIQERVQSAMLRAERRRPKRSG